GTDDGIFNIEGGCYAKCIDLSEEKEPDIYYAIRYGTVLENVVFDSQSRRVDYTDCSVTENTRASYPIEYIENSLVPCLGGHPDNILFLTCDAFGVLPPVSRLTSEQAMYRFISGYTAKVAGTEVGVTQPEATFSSCFGAAFMVWHPSKYAELLADRINQHGTTVWLVNTGWSRGGFETGQRMTLKYSRAIVDAILDGSLQNAPTLKDPVFGLEMITECPAVPNEVLQPKLTWSEPEAYDRSSNRLAAILWRTLRSSKKTVLHLLLLPVLLFYKTKIPESLRLFRRTNQVQKNLPGKNTFYQSRQILAHLENPFRTTF
ncbi:MAG: phosphoenolpyruvate carboxykinase (ATP), partial [bacterium]